MYVHTYMEDMYADMACAFELLLVGSQKLRILAKQKRTTKKKITTTSSIKHWRHTNEYVATTVKLRVWKKKIAAALPQFRT